MALPAALRGAGGGACRVTAVLHKVQHTHVAVDACVTCPLLCYAVREEGGLAWSWAKQDPHRRGPAHGAARTRKRHVEANRQRHQQHRHQVHPVPAATNKHALRSQAECAASITLPLTEARRCVGARPTTCPQQLPPLYPLLAAYACATSSSSLGCGKWRRLPLRCCLHHSWLTGCKGGGGGRRISRHAGAGGKNDCEPGSSPAPQTGAPGK